MIFRRIAGREGRPLKPPALSRRGIASRAAMMRAMGHRTANPYRTPSPLATMNKRDLNRWARRWNTEGHAPSLHALHEHAEEGGTFPLSFPILDEGAGEWEEHEFVARINCAAQNGDYSCF